MTQLPNFLKPGTHMVARPWVEVMANVALVPRGASPGRERPFVVVCLCLVRWVGKGKHYRSHPGYGMLTSRGSTARRCPATT